MAIGVKQVPIYAHTLPAAAWRLLWWMICRMDENAEIRGGWRIAAAGELKCDRIWVGRCAELLQAKGLIDTAPGKRYAKVLRENLVG